MECIAYDPKMCYTMCLYVILVMCYVISGILYMQPPIKHSDFQDNDEMDIWNLNPSPVRSMKAEEVKVLIWNRKTRAHHHHFSRPSFRLQFLMLGPIMERIGKYPIPNILWDTPRNPWIHAQHKRTNLIRRELAIVSWISSYFSPGL